MTGRTPLYASIPYSALPFAPVASPIDAHKSIDALLDDLDSDSGFSDDGRPDVRVADQPAATDSPAPLQDAPALFPDLAASANAAGASTAPWLRWNSSQVTCSDAVYGSNEDKIDCIWLILGCVDGTVWVFCGLVLAEGGGAGTPARCAGLYSSSQPNLLQSLAQRPSMVRKGSDIGVKRGMPPSLVAGSSRMGTSSMSPSRAASTVHSHSHTRKNRSISLALHGSSGLSGHATPSAPRKASATISVSDFDAAGNDLLDKDLPSPPKSPLARHSPSIQETERPSFSFEELPKLDQLDYSKLAFEPLARIHLDAFLSPIASVKLLPPEGAERPFLCLTENGHLYKLSCVDGTLLSRADVRSEITPRVSQPSFSKILLSSNEDNRIFCVSNASQVVSVSKVNLTVSSKGP